MQQNHFKHSWRNLRSRKGYLAINTVGLAVGIAACLLVFLLIRFETSFDDFHAKKDRIYRVVSAIKTPAGMTWSKASAFPAAQALRLDYPQLENVARIYVRDNKQVAVPTDDANSIQKKFKETVFFADPEFFGIFDFPFLAGDAKTALSQSNTAVLTQAVAEKYFGDWHTAIGKYINCENDGVCKVTGILKDIPANTNFPLQVVLSFETARKEDLPTDWSGVDGSLNTFLVLPPNTTAPQFNKQLQSFVKKYMPAGLANHSYLLQPLADMHYNSRFGTYGGTTFSKQLITALSAIGFFLLVIACINFINLATAQAVNRSREVGVRKVLGGSKTQLIAQFLSETFLITVISVGMAIIFALIALPLLNRILHTSAGMSPDGSLIAFLSGTIAVVTLLSGLYPAVILSRFNPTIVLKSKLTSKTAGGFSMRRILVVFQFAIAQALILGTLIVVSQMNFFQNASMGFDKDAIITVPLANDTSRLHQADALKTELLQQAGIKNVSLSIFTPIDKASWEGDFTFDNGAKKSDFGAQFKWADADYFKTYNISFVAGAPYKQADTVTGFVVNELMARKLGFRTPGEIIGKRLSFWDGAITARIVGVVKDFNSTSLETGMKPVVLGSYRPLYRLLNIKIEPQQVKQTLAGIESLWTKAYPGFTFEYQFLDDKIASLYRQENRLSQLYQLFAGIAIFISCLGLYGFVSFMTVQRSREVGIRKVLGASVLNVIYLLSREFILLIGLAFVIAAPVAYYFMHQWLQKFAYRTNIGIGLFLGTLLIAETIAWLTVGYRAAKAAVTNPVNSLRTE
ncbi:MAG TPA: ABC transporter permease [Puia sp.]|uniref:ABC transporter permease n=1 Tax=Puia sp. TaxID=2045100 RepID=UPI002C65A504|nr:ABC transporter permease [Puia sp.]HVU98638.1 ABC transporter permease [Puia sp.]